MGSFTPSLTILAMKHHPSIGELMIGIPSVAVLCLIFAVVFYQAVRSLLGGPVEWTPEDAHRRSMNAAMITLAACVYIFIALLFL